MNKELQDYLIEERFYKTVVEDGSDVIFIVDFSLTILYHNPSLKHAVGYDNITGKNFMDFIQKDRKKSLLEQFIISKKEPYNSNIEFLFRCIDGNYKYLEFNSVNLKHRDGIDGLILDCRDISQRKRDQEELIRAQKTKEEFLANMSHEIRTPINGISGMVNLMAESVNSPEQQKYLDAIKHSADNLKVIINDILDFSIIESGKLVFERIGFDVGYQLQSVIDSFEYQAREKGINITLVVESQEHTVLIGDPVRLNQILINLINNALKFTNKGDIIIKYELEDIDTNQVLVIFTIKDSGVGIPKNKLDSIFHSFKQADESITRKFGGTGLGLAICKQLVELQGGKISVSSTLDIGTEFTFSLPYKLGASTDLLIEDTDSESRSTIGHSDVLTGMNVLLVEDNDINRLYAANVLKKWGCDFEEAENGLIALEKLKKNDYDVVLMDVQMPVLDGLEAARTIRTSFPESKKNTPIIAFTANALKGDRDKYIKMGMNDYLSKPFMPDDLYKILINYYNPEKPESASEEVSEELTDLTYLKKLSNNDSQFFKELVSSFVDKTPELLDEMSQATRSSDWNGIGLLAHKLKPNLAFMGIESLKELVLKIESNGKELKDIENITNDVNFLIEQCKKAIVELKYKIA